MNRIKETFTRLKAEGRKAFMPFLTAGDPDLDTTRRLILGMEKAGASLVEVGIPFSDSIADGPTIQEANNRSLAGGTTVAGVLEMVKELRKVSQIPVLLMGCYNPVVVYGVEKFCADAKEAGADGLIIADVLPDSSDELLGPARKHGLDLIFLVAPTSTEERLQMVEEKASGFVYAVSLTGVTGVRESLPPELSDFLNRVREVIDLPVCIGFGIGSPETAKQAAQCGDGVIVGSAIVKRVAEATAAGRDPVDEVCSFVEQLVAAIA